MPILFIDANTYLTLYSEPVVRNLQDLINSLKGSLFITQQIVDEVNRNKLKTTIQLRVIKLIDSALITIIDSRFHGWTEYRWPLLCLLWHGDDISGSLSALSPRRSSPA